MNKRGVICNDNKNRPTNEIVTNGKKEMKTQKKRTEEKEAFDQSVFFPWPANHTK